jgi:hypothetical protein
MPIDTEQSPKIGATSALVIRAGTLRRDAKEVESVSMSIASTDPDRFLFLFLNIIFRQDAGSDG